jgi:uncharacterized membrane protein YphA (DoxX/SURF4 family)
MSFRDRLAVTIPPLLIRLCLALTFIWAGLGKLNKVQYDPETAAALANMDISVFVDQAVTPAQVTPGDTEQEPTMPDEMEAPPEESPTDIPPAEEPPAEENTEQPPVDDPDGLARLADPGYRLVLVQNAQPDEDAGTQPEEAPDADPNGGPPPQYTAANFPGGVEALQLYGAVASRLGGTPLESYAGLLAWLAALTELIGGLLLIPGILSRIWGLGLATAMGFALWLTTIEPSLGSTDAFLGFWPHLRPQYGSDAWWQLITGFWQLALCTMALAIFFGGPGRLSVDSLFFGPGTSRKARKEQSD